jgi:hypothetical protein
MGGRVFTVVAENVSLTFVYWKQHVTEMKLLLLLYCLFYVDIVLATSLQNLDSSEKRMFCHVLRFRVEYGPIVVGQLCDAVLALNLSKDVEHEGHTDAICSALSGQKFGHWLLAGMAQTQIASHFNVSRMTIYRLMIRLRDTGNTPDRPRSGRPRVTTLRQDRHIRFKIVILDTLKMFCDLGLCHSSQ